MHPFPDDDHGTICVECFESNCLFYENNKTCDAGKASEAAESGAEANP